MWDFSGAGCIKLVWLVNMIINKVVLLPQDVDTLVTADCWGKNYVCVCVSKLLLTLQATRRPMSDTNGF